jgi:hypothetical protein
MDEKLKITIKGILSGIKDDSIIDFIIGLIED